ncbi:MAG: GNAT family N-acetyltransferase [Xanthomonadales bacterium]|nr:GNAT family N-acetyltransferase [Xanthomonadales bacterium]
MKAKLPSDSGPLRRTIRVRPVAPADAAHWLSMRCALWPDGTVEEHQVDVQAFLDGAAAEPHAVLFAVDEVDAPLGFAELSIRPCAEGCVSQRVAYLEGWFVPQHARRRGVGGALMRGAEAWARAQGCSELASDTQPDNEISRSAHAALGFDEVGLVVCLRKRL